MYYIHTYTVFVWIGQGQVITQDFFFISFEVFLKHPKIILHLNS